MGPLARLASWPARTASAVVVGPDGVLDAWGPTITPLPLASLTKPLFALTVLVAIEEGTLTLEDPAGPPGSTVRHLLAHASGLPFGAGDPVADPGRRRIYSNQGFEVLGELLATVSGVPVTEYMTEAVVVPLSLESTSLAGSPAHGAVASAEDIARFAHELLVPTIVAPETLADATEVQLPGLAGVVPGFGRFDPNDWGLGFEIKGAKVPHWTARHGSPRTYGHFGATGTFLWVDPEARIALACLTDEPFGKWATTEWPLVGQAVLERWG